MAAQMKKEKEEEIVSNILIDEPHTVEESQEDYLVQQYKKSKTIDEFRESFYKTTNRTTFSLTNLARASNENKD